MQMSQHNNEKRSYTLSLSSAGHFRSYRSAFASLLFIYRNRDNTKKQGQLDRAHTQTSALLALLSYTASNSKKRKKINTVVPLLYTYWETRPHFLYLITKHLPLLFVVLCVSLSSLFAEKKEPLFLFYILSAIHSIWGLLRLCKENHLWAENSKGADSYHSSKLMYIAVQLNWFHVIKFLIIIYSLHMYGIKQIFYKIRNPFSFLITL